MMTFKISAVLNGKATTSKSAKASSWDEIIASGKNERTATECDYISIQRVYNSGKRVSKKYLIF